MPRKVKKRRKAVTEDGTDAGWEEYYDYIFPDDEVAAPSLKLLALAKQWKKTAPEDGEEEEEEEEESGEEEEGSEEESEEEEGVKDKDEEGQNEKEKEDKDADTDMESSEDEGDEEAGDWGPEDVHFDHSICFEFMNVVIDTFSR